MMKRNMKYLLLASLLGFVSLTAQAVPAKKGVWHMVTLIDGTQKRVELRGDEFCSYWMDAEGICYNIDSGSKRYVKVDAKNLQLRGSLLRAKANQDRTERMAKARRMAAKKVWGKPMVLILARRKVLSSWCSTRIRNSSLATTRRCITGWLMKLDIQVRLVL